MKTVKFMVWALIVLMLSALVPVTAFAALGGTASPGWTIYTAGQYRYGPSIIINADNSIDMWTCAPGTGGAWDFNYYRHSTDNGHTWTADIAAIQPTAGGRDHYSTCDPGVVKFDGYYYMGYTSTEDSRGTDNDIYFARATSPTGPWSKWNGTGWGGSPQPAIVFDDPHTDTYGAGEPSLVVKGTTLYVYYTWLSKDGSGNEVNQTRVKTVSTTNANWPGALAYQGVAVNRGLANGEDSTDHKYIPSLDKFIAVGTAQRFTSSSYIKIYESADGITYTSASTLTSNLIPKLHNMGISGNELGQYDPAQSNFIAYACGDNWGAWDTYLNPITLSDGLPSLSVTASSSLSGWEAPRVVDGNTGTNWSSNSHGSAVANEWIYIDNGSVKTISNVSLTPRSGGMSFPVDFTFETSNNATTWTAVPGQSYTSYVNPGSAVQNFTFASSVSARYIRLNISKLGTDDYGNHYAQLAEFAVNAISNVNLAAGKTVTSNSSLTNSDWGVSKLTDSITTSVAGSNGYTSNAFGSANISSAPVWVDVSLGSSHTVNQVKLFPRTGATGTSGGSANFPVNFTIEVSTDGTNYSVAQTVTGQVNPAGISQSYTFTPVTASHVRVKASGLGSPATDESSSFRLQLAEMEVFNSSGTPAIITVANSGFEAPSLSNFQYGPTGSSWNFTGSAGIQHNGSDFGASAAPEGVQTALLQNDAEMNQSVAFTAGTYKVNFKAAKRSSGGTQTFNVYYDSTLIGTFSPSSTSFTSFSTSTFTATAGNHVIKFLGTMTGDNTDFIDDVTIN